MMANCLFYVVPISLIGFMAAAVPAGAALRSDGDAGTPAAASAKSSDAPMMLAQRGGGRGGGGGARAAVVGHVPAVGMPEERAAVTQAGPIAVLPPEAATGPAFPRATAASTPPITVNRTNVNTANVNRNVNVSGGGYYGGGYSGPGWGGVAAGVAAGAVVGAAATSAATSYYPAPAGLIARTPIIQTAGFTNPCATAHPRRPTCPQGRFAGAPHTARRRGPGVGLPWPAAATQCLIGNAAGRRRRRIPESRSRAGQRVGPRLVPDSPQERGRHLRDSNPRGRPWTAGGSARAFQLAGLGSRPRGARSGLLAGRKRIWPEPRSGQV